MIAALFIYGIFCTNYGGHPEFLHIMSGKTEQFRFVYFAHTKGLEEFPDDNPMRVTDFSMSADKDLRCKITDKPFHPHRTGEGE